MAGRANWAHLKPTKRPPPHPRQHSGSVKETRTLPARAALRFSLSTLTHRDKHPKTPSRDAARVSQRNRRAGSSYEHKADIVSRCFRKSARNTETSIRRTKKPCHSTPATPSQMGCHNRLQTVKKAHAAEKRASIGRRFKKTRADERRPCGQTLAF